ncbi:MAG: 16S rRNA (uracil(1498)-N(3))-methyltransferase [Bacteroidales bacterium]|jgi:16S rRNA (uracil1498-N3)-methyltransferase|nr:16S rRNA (uracil(1498)-N(3))-methyltransferase [Bacteroidales bacterium]MCI1786397.1 16S rRNA (uracil(1498)-N(3))-methyltransferase [Bacteroidales bacterium]
MEIFYSNDFHGNICRLDKDESGHCVRVLRHKSGDIISVIDGEGTMYECRITDDDPREVRAEISKGFENWGRHPYNLHMAVCPTKNNDRYEWMLEKSTEIGLDRISPVIGERSERKVFKTERAGKILLSAAKQSLKSVIPVISEPETVREFIQKYGKTETKEQDGKILRMIAYCFDTTETEKSSVKKVLDSFNGNNIIILIGPEGDFTVSEAEYAISEGFVPIHLGDSRLRTETAAVVACTAVYLHFTK